MATIHFQGWTQAELEAAIKALEIAFSQQILTVDYNGRSVTYTSPGQQTRALEMMRAALAQKTGETAPRRTRRVVIRPDGKGF